MDSDHYSSSCNSSASSDEVLWNDTDPNVDELKKIAEEHMCSACVEYHPLGKGAYARVFLFSFEDGSRVVGRVSLPIRECLKTEAEVAAMTFVKAQTSIPVPKVYLFCSDPRNPVGAEWVLMEYLLGKRFVDCFDNLSHPQKCQTATDLADIMASLFSITSSFCGSILQYESPTVENPPRYHAESSGIDTSAWQFEQKESSSILVGPVNDITFLGHPNQVPASSCGPFASERQFMQAFAYRGIPPTRPHPRPDLSAFEKVLEVYDAVRPHHPGADQSQFHFAHGDLSVANLLLDPATGHITGVVDWEMAGFRPAWLAAVAAGWFDDDSCRFLVTDSQDDREEYDEAPEDTNVREHFRTRLKMRSEQLFDYHWNGVELRAIFYNLCQEYEGNAEVWLEKYEQVEWPESRGEFPFDVASWIEKRMDTELDNL